VVTGGVSLVMKISGRTPAEDLTASVV